MKILEEYDAPFGTLPELRLSFVPRWAIVSMAKTQSVAEHSFNVAIITKRLCRMLMYSFDIVNNMVVYALDHDYDEVYTGDIPTPAKVKVKVKDSDTPTVIKLADVIEAYIFVLKYCNDTPQVKRWIVVQLVEKIEKLSAELTISVEVDELIKGAL